VTGCDKISPGCKHCYAERMAHRLRAMANKNYRHGFDVTLHPVWSENSSANEINELPCCHD
jgi:protein gp37